MVCFRFSILERVPLDIVHVFVYNTRIRRQSLILGYLN